MPTYYSQSRGQAVEMCEMHPGHLINALNKQAKEAVALGEPFRGEQLQLIGELAVALVQKGCLLQVVIQGKDELALDIQAAQRRGDYAKTAALEAVRDLRDNE